MEEKWSLCFRRLSKVKNSEFKSESIAEQRKGMELRKMVEKCGKGGVDEVSCACVIDRCECVDTD